MKRTLKVATVIMFVFFAYSCQTDSDMEQNIYKKNLSAKTTEITPDFELNKYDQAGLIHNQILQIVINKHQQDLSIDDYINFSREEYYNRYPDKSSTLFLSNEYIKNILKDAETNYSSIINSTTLNRVQRKYFTEFITILTDFEELESDDYIQLKNQIITFETKIIRNPAITEKDKQFILTITSIGRHSAYFWNTKYINSRPNEYQTNGLIGKRKWWKWISVGIADVAGGISGGIAGGAISGGLAVVAGAIAGAIGASSGASTLVDWISPEKP